MKNGFSTLHPLVVLAAAAAAPARTAAGSLRTGLALAGSALLDTPDALAAPRTAPGSAPADLAAPGTALTAEASSDTAAPAAGAALPGTRTGSLGTRLALASSALLEAVVAPAPAAGAALPGTRAATGPAAATAPTLQISGMVVTATTPQIHVIIVMRHL